MNPSDLKIRFDELCAGRAMGDLDMDEERELKALSRHLGLDPDGAFELLAASLEMDALFGSAAPMVIGFASIKIGIPAAKGSLVEHPNLGTGLAVMSLCLLVFLISFLAYSAAKALYKTVTNAWSESRKQ